MLLMLLLPKAEGCPKPPEAPLGAAPPGCEVDPKADVAVAGWPNAPLFVLLLKAEGCPNPPGADDDDGAAEVDLKALGWPKAEGGGAAPAPALVRPKADGEEEDDAPNADGWPNAEPVFAAFEGADPKADGAPVSVPEELPKAEGTAVAVPVFEEDPNAEGARLVLLLLFPAAATLELADWIALVPPFLMAASASRRFASARLSARLLSATRELISWSCCANIPASRLVYAWPEPLAAASRACKRSSSWLTSQPETRFGSYLAAPKTEALHSGRF